MAQPGIVKSGTGARAPSNLDLAVNAAVNMLAQIQIARNGGLNSFSGSLDNKRQNTAWREYGFPEQVTFEMLYKLYRRGGIAHGAIEKLVGKCWQSFPEVIQGDASNKRKRETPWERRNKPLLGASWFWRMVADADRKRLIGRWSALLLHVADGKPWDQPVVGSPMLVKMTPAWASALTPQEFDSVQTSPRYGEPTVWQYKEQTRDGVSAVERNIHPDRIFILGDYRGDSIGFLEPVYNAFVSLEKVEGGSGESFLKNAARQLVTNFDKEINFAKIAEQYKIPVEQLHTRLQDAAFDLNAANDMMLITQGGTTTPLVTAVSDPTPTYTVNLQTVAAGIDIPSKILIGNQTGERASTEDQIYFNGRCQGRRTNELSFEIVELVEHLMRIGVVQTLPRGFTPIWDDLTESTQGERLTNAKTMSEINAQSIGTGEPVFQRTEIRDVAGFENNPDDLTGTGDDTDPPPTE